MRILNHLEEVKGIFQRSKMQYLVVLLTFLILIARMFWLQIYQGSTFYRRSKNNFILSEKVDAPRGDILAADGSLLATTEAAFRISVVPIFFTSRASRRGTFNMENVRRIASILHLSLKKRDALERYLSHCYGRCKYAPIAVKDELSKSDLLKVVGYLSGMPGVIISSSYRRLYPQGETAAHLTGYIAKINRRERERHPEYTVDSYIGKTGLEKEYESDLRGIRGTTFHVIDSMGRKIELAGIADQELPKPIPSVKGATLQTSIMLPLQKEAMAFFKENSGAIVVMEIHTGRILALASGPSFDPNLLSRRVLPVTVWQQYSLSILHPLINKVVSSTYYPGSTFKVIPAMAGLYYRLITPQKEFLCLGCLMFGRETKCCWNRGGHGFVNLRKSLKESCDIYYYYLSQEIGLNRLASFARLFGVGELTGIDLPSEESGVLPDRQWFRYNHPGQHLNAGYVMNMAIGQGDIRMTPLQLASVYAALAAHGTVMRPKLVDAVHFSSGNVRKVHPEVIRVLDMPDKVYSTILKDLWAVANEPGGTAFYHADHTIPDAAGKTGTSQIMANAERNRIDYTDDERRILTRDDALFAAVFPYKHPEIVAVAVVEHGGHGGSAAAPVVYRLLRLWYLQQRNIP